MRWSFAVILLACSLLSGTVSAAPPTVRQLAERLKQDEDFRVRVQAALELGKTAEADALEPLLSGLDDRNASVRTAAAAALEHLGDPDAIPALKARRFDRSEAVRKQVKATLESLTAIAEGGPPPARVLVTIGSMRNQTAVKAPRIEAELESESRKKLAALPGVAIAGKADSHQQAEKKKLPVVMVSGQIQKLKARREGDDIVYSASVEYVLHTMPGHSIAATVSGSASGTLTEAEAKNERRASELRHAVLSAAIDSALRRAPRALLAAARL
jgi:hypothetical protein